MIKILPDDYVEPKKEVECNTMPKGTMKHILWELELMERVCLNMADKIKSMKKRLTGE